MGPASYYHVVVKFTCAIMIGESLTPVSLDYTSFFINFLLSSFATMIRIKVSLIAHG